MKYYSVRCRKCRYSRLYGNAELTAKTKATSHALRLMHTVDITASDLPTLSNEIVETISPKVTQKNLGLEGSTPPF